MSDKKIHLEILTPEKKVVDENVDYVSAPGFKGEFGVLPGHADLVLFIGPGEVSFNAGGLKSSFAVSWGYAYADESSVSILVENVEKAEEIDLERARKELEILEKEMAGMEEGNENLIKTRMKKERAQARFDVAARFVEKK